MESQKQFSQKARNEALCEAAYKVIMAEVMALIESNKHSEVKRRKYMAVYSTVTKNRHSEAALRTVWCMLWGDTIPFGASGQFFDIQDDMIYVALKKAYGQSQATLADVAFIRNFIRETYNDEKEPSEYD